MKINHTEYVFGYHYFNPKKISKKEMEKMNNEKALLREQKRITCPHMNIRFLGNDGSLPLFMCEYCGKRIIGGDDDEEDYEEL